MVQGKKRAATPAAVRASKRQRRQPVFADASGDAALCGELCGRRSHASVVTDVLLL